MTSQQAGGPPEIGSAARLAAARVEFASETVYLDTASIGLPPRRSLEALDAVVRDWRAGRANGPDFDLPIAAARASYAALVGVDAANVAVGSQVSVFVGLVAAGLAEGSEATMTILRLVHEGADAELAGKMADFSSGSLMRRWQAGESDVGTSLTHPLWLAPPPRRLYGVRRQAPNRSRRKFM